MSDFLKHPFVLLLSGAVLTGLIIPAITRWWQVQQKELEIKIELVEAVSQSVMTFLTAIQLVHIGARRYEDDKQRAEFMENLNKAYPEWEVDSAVIGTKLRAYFPSTEIETVDRFQCGCGRFLRARGPWWEWSPNVRT